MFSRKADALLSRAERDALIDLLSSNPGVGDEIPGTGGVRKLRFGAGGRGKRGGFRVIYYVLTADYPIVAITQYGKNEQSDLTPQERKGAQAIVTAMKAELRGEAWASRGGPMSEFLEAMQEAADIVTGRRSAARLHLPRAVDVRGIRRKLKLTQGEFASRFGFAVVAIRDWEAGRSQPDEPTRSYLRVIEKEPAAVERALHPAAAA